MALRFLTAGESHGPSLTVILEGFPAGLRLSRDDLNSVLRARQAGYGRGGRMKIEQDEVEVTAGLRFGVTLGSPLCLRIANRDFANWQEVMSPWGTPTESRVVTAPRPGHADLPGSLKYGHLDLRNVLERASARETAARTAAGAVALQFLREFGIRSSSYTRSIGPVAIRRSPTNSEEIARAISRSMIRCPDSSVEGRMLAWIRSAQRKGESVGGVATAVFEDVPVGLGSHVHWDRRLDARLAAATMSIPSVKGVEIGDAFASTKQYGSTVHDVIVRRTTPGPAGRFRRRSDRAGGIEGGMSNGEPIVVHAALKPLATLARALPTIDVRGRRVVPAARERTDTCVVPAGSVVLQSVLALVLADAVLEKFGGDQMSETLANYRAYFRSLARR